VKIVYKTTTLLKLYPTLPRIDDTLDVLAGARWLSTLDLKSGHWQVDAHSGESEYRAFSTGQVLLQFTFLPLGVGIDTANIERLAEDISHTNHVLFICIT
jgi:hypothetical protein